MAFRSTNKEIPVTEIRDDFEDLVSAGFPISTAQLLRCDWEGFVVTEGGVILAAIEQSEEHQGLFHCRVVGETASETCNPVPPSLAKVTVDDFLGRHGLDASILNWKPQEKRA